MATPNIGLTYIALGDTSWKDEEDANKDTIDTLFDAASGHAHDGTAGNGPTLSYLVIDGLGSVATLDVAASGDAASGQAVTGDDSRLTDSRAPSGAAGGVLGGTYPNPSFAADMATQAELDAHISDTSAAHAASAIGFSATGGLSSTDVQAAIAELDTEKAAASHTHAAADVTSGVLAIGRLATGTPDGTKFVRDDGTLAVPAGTGFANPMTTAADLIVGGTAGAPARLAKGSDGQVLTVDPTTHLLVWATPAAGGAALTVEEVDASPTDSAVTKIVFPNGTLGIAAHVATYTPAADVGFANPMTTAEDLIIGGVAGAAARKAKGTNGQFLATIGGALAWADYATVLTPIIDGGGVAITTGVKLDLIMPWAGTIDSVTLLADQSGSIVLDLWKDSYANYPPTVADTITASAKPTLSSASKGQDATLTGWTTTFAAGDVLRINVDSASTITRLSVGIAIRRTA